MGMWCAIGNYLLEQSIEHASVVMKLQFCIMKYFKGTVYIHFLVKHTSKTYKKNVPSMVQSLGNKCSIDIAVLNLCCHLVSVCLTTIS